MRFSLSTSATLLLASSAATAAVIDHAAAAAAAAGSPRNAVSSPPPPPLVHRSPGSTGGSIKIPLYKRGSLTIRSPANVFADARRQKQRIKNRYGHKQTTSATSSSSSTSSNRREQQQQDEQAQQEKRGTVGLVGYGPDSFYFGQVAIGTPPQLLDINLDTGSADFWVADSECTSSACQGIIPYNEEASSTLIKSQTPWEIQYSKGAARGLLAADTVSYAGYTVVNCTFSLALQVADVLNPPISGLMGLGWKSLSTSGATPFWQAVVEAGDVKDQVFSFQLARNNDAENLYDLDELPLNPGGVFTLGEIDTDQFSGQITWHTVPNRFIQQAGYWAIEVESVTLQGRTAVTTGQYGVIDTGTTLIAGPSNLIAAFYNLIPNAQAVDDGFYVYPCETQVELAFTFDGTTYDINPSDFNFGPVGQGYCMGSLFEENLGQNAPSFIVGDTFLKNVYSAYRYNPPSVGFAALRSSGAQVLPLPSGVANTAAPISASTRPTAGVPTSTVPDLLPTGEIQGGDSSPTGLAGGPGLPDPSVVGGTSPSTSVRFSTQSAPPAGSGSSSGSNGSNSGGGGGLFGNTASPQLSSAGGMFGVVLVAMVAGAGALLL